MPFARPHTARAQDGDVPLQLQILTTCLRCGCQGCPLLSFAFDFLPSRFRNRNQTVNARDHQGDTPLSCAAENGLTDISMFLLENGAKVSWCAVLEGTEGLRASDWLLHLHLFCNRLTILVQVNSANNQGETALHKAARAGYRDISILLLDMGADPLIISKVCGLDLRVQHE
jgi:hypothetical protein